MIDDRVSSVGSAELDALKLSKEFRNILSQSGAVKFTGENPKEYKSWSKDLEDEVMHLNLTPAQWRQLLLRRTSHHAQDLIKSCGNYSEEMGMDAVVKSI